MTSRPPTKLQAQDAIGISIDDGQHSHPARVEQDWNFIRAMVREVSAGREHVPRIGVDFRPCTKAPCLVLRAEDLLVTVMSSAITVDCCLAHSLVAKI
jgi:hypothetical protein